MRFQLTLVPETTSSVVPVNYQYPVSEAIHKLISTVIGTSTYFLRNHAYRLIIDKRLMQSIFSALFKSLDNKSARLMTNGVLARLIVGYNVKEARSWVMAAFSRSNHKKSPAL